MLKNEMAMSTEWSMLMAATVITVLPVLLFLIIAQKYIIEGISLSGLKG
jgi:multiple sugar transport system permease protein